VTYRFNGSGPFVGVRVRIAGPTGAFTYAFALDTGATWTVVRPGILSYLGYDVDSTGTSHAIVTAMGATNAPRLPVQQIDALGIFAAGLRVLCRQLPEGLRVGGVLGLDFLRGGRLEVDFAAGTIDLD